MSDSPQAARGGPGRASREPAASPSPRERWRRRGIALGVVLVAGLLPLCGRAAWDGAAQLRAADEARAAGALDAEIEHLGRALRWRAPLVDHDERALARLWAIGEAEQARGEAGRDGALAAFREIRRALLATRSWGDIPQRERWEAANERIAALMAEQSEAMGLPAAADPRAELHEQLARVPGPDPLRADLSALAFVGWLGCVVGFVLRGLDAKGRLRLPAAARWGVGALGLLVAWAVLLAVAHG